MTLQTSGQISLDDIGDEFEVAAANRSLATLSAAGGFTAPHGIKEFYGFSDTIPVSGIGFCWASVLAAPPQPATTT